MGAIGWRESLARSRQGQLPLCVGEEKRFGRAAARFRERNQFGAGSPHDRPGIVPRLCRVLCPRVDLDKKPGGIARGHGKILRKNPHMGDGYGYSLRVHRHLNQGSRKKNRPHSVAGPERSLQSTVSCLCYELRGGARRQRRRRRRGEARGGEAAGGLTAGAPRPWRQARVHGPQKRGQRRPGGQACHRMDRYLEECRRWFPTLVPHPPLESVPPSTRGLTSHS